MAIPSAELLRMQDALRAHVPMTPDARATTRANDERSRTHDRRRAHVALSLAALIAIVVIPAIGIWAGGLTLPRIVIPVLVGALLGSFGVGWLQAAQRPLQWDVIPLDEMGQVQLADVVQGDEFLKEVVGRWLVVADRQLSRHELALAQQYRDLAERERQHRSAAETLRLLHVMHDQVAGA